MRVKSGLRRAARSLIYSLPRGLERRVLFAYYNRRLPRFGNPVTFNDKVNWRILNDRRPLLKETCDKLAAKDYATKAALPGLHVPHTIWSGSDIRDLRAVELPQHWVLKPNHRSGLIYFGNGDPDYRELSMVTATWLDTFEARKLREWAYSAARSMLFVEELLGTPGDPPPDYKFYVFDGEVAAVEEHLGRYSRHQLRLYLPDWSPLNVLFGPIELGPVTAPPPNLDTMLAIASELGRPFDFMRVDLYNINGVIQFGELTPYPSGGLDRFIPASFDTELGKKWKLAKL